MEPANRFRRHAQPSSKRKSVMQALDAYLEPCGLGHSHKVGIGRRKLPAPLLPSDVAPSDMLSGLLLEDALIFNATKKVQNPPDKEFFLAVLAGIFVGMGGLVATGAAGGIPEDVRDRWVSLPKFITGAFFAFAIHFLVFFGGELFTGNTMIMAVGFYNRVVSFRALALNWVLVYVGNWSGTLLVAFFLGKLTQLFESDQYKIYLNELAQDKLEDLSWGVIFLRAIGAKMCVCLALTFGLALRDSAGKFFVLWFPVVVFVTTGYEHSVANMVFCSLALMYGADSSIGRLWYNQSAAICGNIVGGPLMIDLVYHLMNHWNSPIFKDSGSAFGGTLAAHDIESSRRARDVVEIHPEGLVAHCRREKRTDTTTEFPKSNEKHEESIDESSNPDDGLHVTFGTPSALDFPGSREQALERRKAMRALLGERPVPKELNGSNRGEAHPV